VRAKAEPAAKPRKRIAPFAFAAAVVVGVVAAGLSTSLLWNQPRVTSYATPVGGRETIRLADGTTIELNTNTIVRTAFSEKRRTVELVRGEAFFQVRHDERRPFVLLAANHRVIDLGTKFLAREDGTRLKVVLIEGSAKVETGTDTNNAKSALLKPGDEAVATADSLHITRKSDKQLESELGWQRGVLVFQRATLVEVAREYNRYNSRKIVIADAKAGARLITATLPTNDVTGFARMAKNFLGLHVEEREGEIVISH
jgi:transmembrane sensor